MSHMSIAYGTDVRWREMTRLSLLAPRNGLNGYVGNRKHHFHEHTLFIENITK